MDTAILSVKFLNRALKPFRSRCNSIVITKVAMHRSSLTGSQDKLKPPTVAVLYQALDPPVINGVRKPKKPGGYQDSGADIAFVLREQCGIDIVTPVAQPDPKQHEQWCFPDTEEGIIAAVKQGATCLWANTILFSSHPLQTSEKLNDHASQLRIVGQPPRLVDAYDDKNVVNSFLRDQGQFTMPTAFIAPSSKTVVSLLGKHKLDFPVVAKPIRGRGSQGVKLCRNLEQLKLHVDELGDNNTMVEEYLSGTEGTVTVMPPSDERPDYWAMPVVIRFNHDDGIAPYNGAVAVSSNSRPATDDEASGDPAFSQVASECKEVAKILKVTAPIRVDVRKASEGRGVPFTLFDVNMKPNMTAPGRPGREDQASLTAMAAAGLQWTPAMLLRTVLASASTLKVLRATNLPESFGNGR